MIKSVDSIAQDDIIESIEISAGGDDAKSFNAVESSREFEGARAKQREEEQAAAQIELDKHSKGFTNAQKVACAIKLSRGIFWNSSEKSIIPVSVHYKEAID